MQPAELSRALLVLSETHGSEQFACLDHLIGSITRWMLLRVLMSAWIEVTRYKCAPKPHRHNIKTLLKLFWPKCTNSFQRIVLFSVYRQKLIKRMSTAFQTKRSDILTEYKCICEIFFLLFSPKLPTKGVVKTTLVTQPTEFSDWITWLLGLE